MDGTCSSPARPSAASSKAFATYPKAIPRSDLRHTSSASRIVRCLRLSNAKLSRFSPEAPTRRASSTRASNRRSQLEAIASPADESATGASPFRPFIAQNKYWRTSAIVESSFGTGALFAVPNLKLKAISMSVIRCPLFLLVAIIPQRNTNDHSFRSKRAVERIDASLRRGLMREVAPAFVSLDAPVPADRAA